VTGAYASIIESKLRYKIYRVGWLARGSSLLNLLYQLMILPLLPLLLLGLSLLLLLSLLDLS
jgi:hypothetical protein